MTAALALGCASSALILCAVIRLLTGRTTEAIGLVAASSTVGAVGQVVLGDPLGAARDAGLAAFLAWFWWNRGGGDGPRRRLRRWARTFQGVRRTAPAGGAAYVLDTNGRTARHARAASVHTTAPARRDPRMQPLTAALLAAPLLGPLTAAAYRHARRSYRRSSR